MIDEPAPLPDDATIQDIRALLLADGARTRARFQTRFSAQIDALAAQVQRAFVGYRTLDRQVGSDKRRATVVAFYFTSLNSVLSSSQLLLSGHLAAGGHLLRHFGEATAMALLCSHPGIDVYERFSADPKAFPVDDALRLVNKKRNRGLLGLDPEAWESFAKVTAFYDKYSHASLLTIGAQFMFSRAGYMALGGEFDEDKTHAYDIELTRRTDSAGVLANLAPWLFAHVGA